MDGYTYRAPDDCDVCHLPHSLLLLANPNEKGFPLLQVCVGCASRGYYIHPMFCTTITIEPVTVHGWYNRFPPGV